VIFCVLLVGWYFVGYLLADLVILPADAKMADRVGGRIWGRSPLIEYICPEIDIAKRKPF
jgi:hypothetical protein